MWGYIFWKFEKEKYYQKKVYINFKKYQKLKKAIGIYKNEVYSYRGNLASDRSNVIEALANGVDFNKKALEEFEIKVKDFAHSI